MREFVARLFPLFVAVILIASCGKKGPPTLKSYEKPPAPTQLTAIHREDEILLSWAYPDNLRSSIKGFYLLRSKDDAFERYAFIASDKSSFADRNFEVNTSYRYKVIAMNLREVTSADSNIVTATPRPLPSPPAKIGFVVGSDALTLSWDSAGEGVCYNIYKTTDEGAFGKMPINREPECALSYRDAGILPARVVYYRIRPLLNTEIRDEGYASATVEVNPSAFIPSPPSDLRIAAGEDRVHLVWKESPEAWVKGYRVYRRVEGGPEFTLIGEVALPSFTDPEKSGKRVRYMIRALGPSAESAPLVGEMP